MSANYNVPCIQTVLNNSEFRNVLDQNSEEVMLCKRRMDYSSSPEMNLEAAPAKLLKIVGSTKPCHSVGDAHHRNDMYRVGAESPNLSSISSKYQGTKTTCEIRSQNNEEKRSEFSSLNYLLKNQFECQKELTKHFIYESFLNEKLNMNRFEFLPTSCKNQVSIFFKECLGYDVQEETKGGSNRKHLYSLKNCQTEDENDMQKARRAIAFRAQCYIYGLRKQLHCEATAEGNDLLVKTLFKVIHPESTDQQLIGRFRELLFTLIDESRPFDSDEMCGVLTTKLLSKIRQLPDAVLRKYYHIKLSKYLGTLFGNCNSSHDIVDRLLPLNQKIDLYSNLQTESVPKIRTYQLAVLL